MNVNINHPSFIAFLEGVTRNILTNVTIENYFTLPQPKKTGIQYVVLKLMKKSVSVRAKLTDNELLSFIGVLRKRNEESENYEFSAILKDISSNFETLNVGMTTKIVTKVIKTEKIDKPNESN